MGAINHDLSKIESLLVAIDCCIASDGVSVLSDGRISRHIGIKDLNAIAMAASAGLSVYAVSSPCKVQAADGLEDCLASLGANVICSGSGSAEAMERHCASIASSHGPVMCLCGEVHEFSAMRGLGPVCCPSDAAAGVIAMSVYVSTFKSGAGFVRDVIEQVLRSQGKCK